MNICRMALVLFVSALLSGFILTPDVFAADASPQKSKGDKPAAVKKEEQSSTAPKKSDKRPATKKEESLEVVTAKLQEVGQKLAQNAAKMVTPNKSAKAVTNEGGAYIARYVDIDASALTTEVRESTGAGGKYIGVIRYVENHYECRAGTQTEALSAPCVIARSRRVTELIRYDGKWIF